MSENIVFFDYINVCDDDKFTEARVNEWRMQLKNAYADVYNKMKSIISHESPIQFFISRSLLDEVLVDAVIGMRKITTSENNSVEDPNAFKVAAYLSYWWLRHKPVSLHYPKGYRIEDVAINRPDNIGDEEYEEDRKKFSWRLKHINEIVAVQFVSTYIFDFSKVVCDDKICLKVKKREEDNFCFEDFEDMRRVLLNKLIYYFSYRAIAPKMIEHMLEAYTFHPAWGLTGSHWNGGDGL